MTADTAAITTPIFITDNAALVQLCSRWGNLPFLALDTEFIRVNTFFPKLGLLQVCDNEHSYLLDPLRLTDWVAFRDILLNPRIVKILHSCSEDLVVFNEYFGLVPTPVFDTQKAAAFTGLGFSLSYQNLVKQMLDIDVPKGETRSDWLRRPLSQEQLIYAALDVAWLPEVYRTLTARLEELDRLQWLQEDCELMRAASSSSEIESSWDTYYLGLGAAWRLNERQLGALKELCRWREVEARQRNKPRSWIAKDADLINIAARLPADLNSLRSIPELPGALAGRDGMTLLELVARGTQNPATIDALNRPLSSEMRKTLKHLQSTVRRVAGRMEMAEELLMRKKGLIALLLAFREHGELRWPDDVTAWRRDLLQEPLLAALSQPKTDAAEMTEDESTDSNNDTGTDV